MTRQEFFDTAARGIILQGKPSISKDGLECLYRSKKNGKILKCAIGQCIPDELYKPSFENQDIKDVIKALKWNAEDTRLLRNIQNAHDLASDYFELITFLEYFKLRMLAIAKRYKLKPDVLFE